MNDALVLFGVEVRRCLARRLVWVLVGLAVAAIAVMSVLVFVNTADDKDAVRRGSGECMTEIRPDGSVVRVCPSQADDDLLRLVDVWPGERILGVTVVFLAIGALLGGASMVGADWKAGTFTTLLTWEPRRERLVLARFAAVASCAFVIALLLQLLFIAALLPAVLAHGTTAGADAAWFRGLATVLLRSEALVAMAAVVGAAVAMVGRNTAAALGGAFAYMVIGEQVIRGWKPGLRPWLLFENSFLFLVGYGPDALHLGGGSTKAAVRLSAYTLGLVAVAVATFRSRDVAGA